MNIKTITAIAFSSLLAFPVFAMDYPTFGGITLDANTTAAEYIIYFFNLAVAIGAFIAVIMIVIAGIEWITSNGEPGKITSAKGRIANTLLGIAVLVGCYLILNTINPQLTNIKINDLSCDNGIAVSVKPADGSKVKGRCIDSNQTDIGDTIITTKSWNFPDKYLLKVYIYSESNYKGTVTEFDCSGGACSGEIAGAKSIYFVLNNPGIYLYDDNSYKPASPAIKGYPVFASASIPDLSKVNSFDNFTKSLKIINSDQTTDKIQYQAVVFRDQNYQGRCAFVGQSVPDMDQAPSGTYTDNVGDGTISSIIVSKANLDQAAISANRGEIILYTKTNCGKSSTDPAKADVDVAKKEIKACHIKIDSSSSGLINIMDQCKSTQMDPVTKTLKEYGFEEGDEVKSFEITGAAGLVLSTSKKLEGSNDTYCQYFNKTDLGGGTCMSTIEDKPIFTVGGKTPQSFIIIPDN